MNQEATAGLYLTSPSGETFTHPFFLLLSCFAVKPSTAAAEPLASASRPAEMWISPDRARQFHSPYATGGNPVNRVDPDGNAEYDVKIMAYIPFKSVGGLHGDNRGPNPNASSYRLMHQLRVETNPSVSSSALLSSSFDAGPSFFYGNYLGTSSASHSAQVFRMPGVNGGDNVVLNLTASGAVPLIIPSPAIDWDLSLQIVPGKGGVPSVQLSGYHDGFPAYEVYVSPAGGAPAFGYTYTPSSPLEALRLMPPTDVPVSR